MRKQTKRRIWAFIIIFIMFGSTIAFVALGIFTGTPPQQQQQQEVSTPVKFVVDEKIDLSTREQYIQRGYSILEFHYYENCCRELQFYIGTMPENLEFQLIVEKRKDLNTDDQPWISIESLQGSMEKNVTDISDLFEPVCTILLKPPPDCFLNISS